MVGPQYSYRFETMLDLSIHTDLKLYLKFKNLIENLLKKGSV